VQRDLVEKLLTKLNESARSVITLHYFEEMPSAEIGTFLGVSENTIKSRIRRARQRLKKYEFMIQEALDITTEGESRSQNQLEGEVIMTEKARDESKVEASLEEMQRSPIEIQRELAELQVRIIQESISLQERLLKTQREFAKMLGHHTRMPEQIQATAAELNACRKELSKFANPQRQPWGTTAESNALHPDDIQFHDSRKSEALKTLCCLPMGAERPIGWGYVGGYRTSPGKVTGRIAYWLDNIDNFLSKAPYADIVNLACLFTNPTVVAVL